MKCTLTIDGNNCPFCDRERMECRNKKKCSFQEDETVPIPDRYIRKERWYEKYCR